MHDCSKSYSKLPPEQQAIRDKCFHPLGEYVEFSLEDVEASIPERFEKIVRLHPGRLAVKSITHALSYEQLNQAANRVAHAIASKRRRPEGSVALLIENDTMMIAAILGVLKAAKIYVPLDPSSPRDRLNSLLQEFQPSLILTDTKALPAVMELNPGASSVLNIDALDAELSVENPDFAISADAVAAIYYTSGSTGRPKGVIQSHRGVLHRVLIETNSFHICSQDRLSLLSSPTYSVSLRNLFGALLNGAMVAPLNIKEQGLGNLADWLSRESITIYFSVPTIFRHFIESLTKQNDLDTIRLIYLGGEGVTKRDVELFQQYFSRECVFVNSLASNEAGVFRQYFIDQTTQIADETLVPVGYKIDGKELLLLGDGGQEVEFGEVGEIAVRSRYLSPGYWQEPELTAAAFLPDPEGGDNRIYRTGDLGRLRPDGCLLYLGRKDLRVKIRGARVELEEVEAVLRSHPSVRETVVATKVDESGESRLIAYIVPVHGYSIKTSDLRRLLQEKLPGYMLPSAFVIMDALPLTSNAKVDRQALPEPANLRPDLDTPYLAPTTPVEKKLTRIWNTVLGLEQIGIHDNFFDLGGHSLAAMRIASYVLDHFQLEMPIQSLFQWPTVAEMAGLIAAHEESTLGGRTNRSCTTALSSPKPISRDRDLPLSFAQQRLWFLNQLEPESPLYNEPKTLRLKGELDVARLQGAVDGIVKRHEVLRTTYESVAGLPKQIIHEPARVDLSMIDLTGLAGQKQDEELQRVLSEFKRRPFDLRKDWPIRAALLRITEADHVLILVTHHIATDGWSSDILFGELSALYEGYSHGRASALKELPIQYVDYAVWQRGWIGGELQKQQLSYWRKQLECVSPFELPTDRPRPAVQSHAGRTVRFAIPHKLAERLKKFSRREKVTLFMSLLAAFQTLLQRYTGQDDISVGSLIAGRNRKEAEGLIGFFVNTLVLRNDFSGNPTFRELLARVKQNALDAFSHQDVPFEKLVEELQPERALGRNPFFQVMFQLRNYPKQAVSLGDLNIEECEIDTDIAKFDLSVGLRDDETGLSGSVEYRTDLFDADTIERLVGHFQVMLEGIIANPDQPISRLPLLTEAEKHQLLVEWNDTKTDYPKDKFIHQLFEEQAERTPEAVAVVFEDQQVTYRELNHRSNQLAHYLVKLGVGPEVLVAICLERSIDMVVGLLGILKAGGAYVPLDPDFPKERLDFMLQDAQVRLLLTQEKLLSRIDHRTAVCLDSDWSKIATESTDNPQSNFSTDNLAYVIYTSGSTGWPKGVAIEHRQLSHYLSSIMDRLDLGSQRSFAMVSTLSADLGNTVIFASLCAGGALHVLTRDRVTDADGMADYFSRHAVDCLKIVPSHLAALQSASRPEAVLPRKLLILGGEASDIDWVKRLAALAPDCRIVNHYGPTETTIGVMTYAVQKDALPLGLTHLPLGRPLANTQIYILDQHLNPVPIGVPGEIYIGGQGLARGYLNRPELTQEKFVANPFSAEPGARLYKTGDRARYLADGNVEFLGRTDNQVKLRGYRIEPGEIEAALKQHPDLREAVVLARPGANGENQLAAYVVATPESAPLIAGKPRYRLPNGTAVAQLNKNETDYIYQEIFERQAYLRHGITINDGDCIFDVGANIGLFMLFVDQIAPRAKVYCFEPNPAVYEILQANAKLANSAVKLFNCGLADRAGNSTFTFFPGFSLLSGFHADAQAEKQVVKTFMLNQEKTGVAEMTELVEQADAILEKGFAAQTFSAELRTLSSIMEQEGIESIDLLKVNVEKSELDVIKGIKDHDWPKIKQLVVEVDVKENLPTITSLLEKHGYEYVVEQDDLLEGTSLCYVYAIRPAPDRRLLREQAAGTHVQVLPASDKPLLSAAELRAFLAARLPEHMIPSAYLFLDALPLTANGKIDRQSLPALAQSEIDRQDRFEAPRTPMEELLANIWAEVLKLNKVGIHDNFFHLGGHSLLATQVVSRARSKFTIRIPLRDFFEAPTIATLAQRIQPQGENVEHVRGQSITRVARECYKA